MKKKRKKKRRRRKREVFIGEGGVGILPNWWPPRKQSPWRLRYIVLL